MVNPSKRAPLSKQDSDTIRALAKVDDAICPAGHRYGHRPE